MALELVWQLGLTWTNSMVAWVRNEEYRGLKAFTYLWYGKPQSPILAFWPLGFCSGLRFSRLGAGFKGLRVLGIRFLV